MTPRRRPPIARVVVCALAVAALASPAGAAAPAPPKKVQIVDPAGDANYVNDDSLHNATAGTVPDAGNVSGPADAGAEADVLAVWFTNDAQTLTVHVHTEAPPAPDSRIVYFVAANPRSAGDWGCLLFALRLNDPAEAEPQVAYLRDQCSGDVRTEARVSIGQFADGTGHVTLTVPRSASGYFADGGVVAAPVADARIGAGTPPVTDDTARGEDYRIRRSR